MTKPLAPTITLAALLLALGGCNCGVSPLRGVDPCALGSVTGRACAPDQRTWIGGADVSFSGLDCRGMSMELHATTDHDGNFQLDGLPVGSRTLEVKSGSFVARYDVTVAPDKVTAVPDDKLCFARDATHIAVVTGKGDHIETLLASMGLTVELTVDGTNAGWTSVAKPFLLNRAQMSRYDVLFIDCAAAENKGSVTLGSPADTTAIVENLRAFVAGGGSVYASDWAFLFLALAWPDQVQVLDPNGAMRSPFPTHELMGWAPQTINARVSDAGLEAALQKDTVTVAFPNEPGAQSRHWGLLEDAGGGAVALLEGNAQTCQGTSRDPMLCSVAGPPAVNVPLAITFTPPSEVHGKQGRVTFTSFHNIAQPTGDVEAILRYLVFHL